MASPSEKDGATAKLMASMSNVTAVFLRVTETGFALVALIVLVYLLLGEASGAFVIGVVTNVVLLIGAIGPEALVGVAIVLALVYLIRTRNGRS